LEVEFAARLDRGKIWNSQRRGTHRFPEFAQPGDALLGRITGDNCRIDSADRNSRNPIRMQVGFGERLIDSGLIGAKRTAALHQ
jgi:hypothetical protein